MCPVVTDHAPLRAACISRKSGVIFIDALPRKDGLANRELRHLRCLSFKAEVAFRFIR